MFCVWNTYVLLMKDIKGRCFSERKHEGKVSSGIPPEGRAFFLLVPEVVAAQRQYATQESGQEIEDFGPHASPGSGMETIEISFHLLRDGDLVGSRDSGDGTVFGLETGGIAFPQRAFGRCDYLGAVPLQLDAGIGRIGLLQTCQYLVPGAIRTLGVFRAGIRFIGTCTPRSGIRLAVRMRMIPLGRCARFSVSGISVAGFHCLRSGSEQGIGSGAVPPERPGQSGQGHDEQEYQGIDACGCVAIVPEATPSFRTTDFQPVLQGFRGTGNPDDQSAKENDDHQQGSDSDDDLSHGFFAFSGGGVQ